MKIATFNVNGVNGRLSVLLRWLEEAQPDVVCLQELKAPDEKFPRGELERAGYGAIWHGQKNWNGVAILARGKEPIETRRGLPGETEDSHSRYIEAAIDGIVIGCLYVPNGNPAPGPKFDYKLRWFERLIDYAASLLELDAPVVLAGDYNVMPTELDVYKPERWIDDALFRPEVREAFQALLAQGRTDALRSLYPEARIYTFWDYFRNAWGRNAGLRLDHFLLSKWAAKRLVAADVDRDVRGWEKASDHAPTWIELAERAARRRRQAPSSAPADRMTLMDCLREANRKRRRVTACRVLQHSLPNHSRYQHSPKIWAPARRKRRGRALDDRPAQKQLGRSRPLPVAAAYRPCTNPLSRERRLGAVERRRAMTG